ncbi:RIP metalloprotease RseP [Bordetella pseudohinzii]|uniref:Zinc metalloprotease n=1 Tax=Bordetella pseudohinzii TaxID=1331258 RepID=A0A0J6C0K0_9BORD|nr:RIP metalloprotease RseP [Bordetella pseudohinzii]ANY16034.1 RIP metalloprotease RseP [Bordetella pseudohinzii]KMM24573.1 membrane protein [Bordetella pseudohinzii]KXA76588.1 RIP metalloprotease RseP [Bordetella pseudohinzii]KXA76951.1 RIP metalloprotease RseP [Bordetella pseudohinzii]CUJ09416.1 Regulator of sigma E protease [Bordetella pseudohinzii]
MIFTLLAFVVALGILITFHELGHYWVARLCGVRVLRFSVGFGRVLLRRRDRNGTEWAVSAIPLGGYVKMQDDPPPGATPAQAAEAFNTQPVGRRFAIVAAGPIFNLILAVALYAGLNMVGTQVPAAILGQPAEHSAAAAAGVAAGDRIEAVDGRAVASWTDARWRLFDRLSSGAAVQLEVRGENGAPRTLTLALPPDERLDPSEADPVQIAGLRLQAAKPVVRGVIAGGAGEAAGLREGDLVLTAAGQPVADAGALVRVVQQYAGKPLALTLRRDGAALSLTVTPRAETVQGQVIGRIGVQLGGDVPMVLERFGPVDSLWRGVQRTWDTAWLSLRMMGRMVLGEVSWRNISGPVTIADYAGQTARIGLEAYIAYLALISISLGVLNLLPIPMLDGGHLLYYLVEIVRGRPVPDRWIDIGQRAGIGLLAGLMGLALFNDFARLFT